MRSRIAASGFRDDEIAEVRQRLNSGSTSCIFCRSRRGKDRCGQPFRPGVGHRPRAPPEYRRMLECNQASHPAPSRKIPSDRGRLRATGRRPSILKKYGEQGEEGLCSVFSAAPPRPPRASACQPSLRRCLRTAGRFASREDLSRSWRRWNAPPRLDMPPEDAVRIRHMIDAAEAARRHRRSAAQQPG